MEFVNPIDKDKVAENPGLLPYSHHVGGIVIKPEDTGKIKSRALTAMREQTNIQMNQIQKQVELLVKQANETAYNETLSSETLAINKVKAILTPFDLAISGGLTSTEGAKVRTAVLQLKNYSGNLISGASKIGIIVN